MVDASPNSFNSRDRHIFGAGPKRILALEGGGVRGIMSLAFLQRMETLLQDEHGTQFRLCDWFDLIGGTSTGSAIAAGLALGMSVSELIAIYLDMAKEGFQRSAWHGGYIMPKFKTEALRKAIQRHIGDVTLGSPQVRTGLAIVAKRLDTGSVWVFHNNPCGVYFGKSDRKKGYIANGSLPLAQLVRASTAAPTFFLPEHINLAPDVSATFVDGGVSPHNNPSLLLFMLATLKGYGFNWPTGADALSLTSIGTGYYPLTASEVPSDWEPSMILAITSMRSMLDDSNWLVQTMMQWMGMCRAPWFIDREVGDLSADQLGPSALFRYERFDIELTQEWFLERLGLTMGHAELGQLRAIDDPAMAQRLFDVGMTAAVRQISGLNAIP